MNNALATQGAGLDPMLLDAIGGVRADIDTFEADSSLPKDHPAWQRDIVSISARARALIAALLPLTIRVLSFWDHRLRDITLGARRFGIDASGSYRLHS